MKFFKKWYFKLYHLLKFLGIFIILLIPNIVKAEEYNNCYDNFKVGYYSFTRHSSNWFWVDTLIPVEGNKTYYIRFFADVTFTKTVLGNPPNAYDSNKSEIGTISLTNISYDSNNYIVSFKTPENNSLSYIKILIYRNNTNSDKLRDTPIVISENKDDLTTCPTTPEPEPEGNTKLDNFLTIYIDRLTYLSEKTIENQYMLAFIGVIFGFIVLELTLHIIHIRGGYKK